MKIRSKNSDFQSCRFCNIGGSLYRVDSEEGTCYVCEEHRKEKDFVKGLSIEGVEEEFGVRKGLLSRAIKYVKGG